MLSRVAESFHIFLQSSLSTALRRFDEMALFQKSDTDWQLWERRGEKRELTTESQQNLHPRRFVFSFSLSFGERCDRVYNNSEMKREGVLPRYKGDHELYVKGRLRMTLNPSQVSFVHLLSCPREHSSARHSEKTVNEC